jgi:hypothetical protein
MEIEEEKYYHFLVPGDHHDDDAFNLKKVVSDGILRKFSEIYINRRARLETSRQTA